MEFPWNPMISLNNNEYACSDLNSISIILLSSFGIDYPSEPFFFFGLNKIAPEVFLKPPFIILPIINIFNTISLFKNCLYLTQSRILD